MYACMHATFWSGNLKGRDYNKGISVDVKTVLKWVLGEVGCEDVDWIEVVRDRT
jgi:hypothetical protein